MNSLSVITLVSVFLAPAVLMATPVEAAVLLPVEVSDEPTLTGDGLVSITPPVVIPLPSGLLTIPGSLQIDDAVDPLLGLGIGPGNSLFVVAEATTENDLANGSLTLTDGLAQSDSLLLSGSLTMFATEGNTAEFLFEDPAGAISQSFPLGFVLSLSGDFADDFFAAAATPLPDPLFGTGITASFEIRPVAQAVIPLPASAFSFLICLMMLLIVRRRRSMVTA